MRHQVIIEGKVSSFYCIFVTLVKKTGHIIGAMCNCKAGLSGVCSHVGGTVLELVKQANPCTSAICQWKKPKGPSRSPERWENIRFVKTEKVTKQETTKPYSDVFQAGPCVDADTFCQELLEGLAEANRSCVLYQTLCGKLASIDDFMSIYDVNLCFADCIDICSEECVSEFSSFMDNMYKAVTLEIAEHVEVATRGQASNQNWKNARNVLITSSNFGSVCKRQEKTPPDNLLKTLRGYVTPPAELKSLHHGRKYESKAR